jgi:HEPN domain-containing protein
MTVSRNLTEAQRWLKQALHDRDAARLNRDHDFHEHACFLALFSARAGT